MSDVQTWVVGMLKGGTRKTTTAFYLAWALARTGYETLVIDADAGTQGVSEWSGQLAVDHPDRDLPFSVRGWAYGMEVLPLYIRNQAAATSAQRVVVDLGAEYPQVLRQAAQVADRVIVPVGVDNAELVRLSPTRQMLIDGGARQIHVLLTRVPAPGKGAALAVRKALTDQGYHVLNTEIPRDMGRYADTFGQSIEDLGAYADLLDELMDMGAARVG